MKTTYHHGNLREALIDAARSLLADVGVDAVSLRAVARRAGVSVGAPYHHFTDKAGLLNALVQRCFADMDREVREALAGKTLPSEKLKAIGVAYVLYAVAHPAEFRLMFRPEKGAVLAMPNARDAPVYGVLLQVIDELHAQGTGTDRDSDAIAAWSVVHGLAALLIDGPLQALGSDSASVRKVAEAVTERLILVNGV